MRRTATIALGTGVAAVVFGSGLALAFDGGGGPSRAGTATAEPSDQATTTPSDTASPSDPPSTAPSGSPSPSGSGIGRSAAERIALRAVPGGRIESVERELEHGRLVWDVDVLRNGVEYDLHIDARSGIVVRMRTDRADHRADDGADHRADDGGRHHGEHPEDGRHGTGEGGDDHGGRSGHRGRG